MTWSRAFDAPIVLPDAGEITTLREAGEYVARLPKREHEQPHWQIAIDHLMSAAERGGIVMLADIAMRRALNHGGERPPPAPRKKAAKKYRIVR